MKTIQQQTQRKNLVTNFYTIKQRGRIVITYYMHDPLHLDICNPFTRV